MHPAPSVILFTSLSGMGFGLLFWLGLGCPAPTGWAALGWFALAFALAVGGLISSAFHLGHPERALKAYTQWRSSWLSREAWTSSATLIVAALFGAGAVFFDSRWTGFGWLTAALCLATIFTTSMIYAQLKSVPRWHHWSTPALYLSTSLAGGAVLSGHGTIAIALLLVAAVALIIHWILGARRFAQAGTSLATATGLADDGTIRSLEPPHTGRNYLLDEMVYIVARRRARALRVLAIGIGFVIPALILLVFGACLLSSAIAALLHLVGLLASRWLFFAEAEHVVGLYYAKR